MQKIIVIGTLIVKVIVENVVTCFFGDTVQVIPATVFTGQKTQPTVSKY